MHAKENIDDRDELLSAAKGYEITGQTGEKLKRYNIKDKGIGALTGRAEHAESSISILEINEKLKLSNTKALDCSAKILGRILFESRTKPWGPVIDTLSNYIGWVYTHSINVSLISLMIGLESGYDDETLYELSLGSLLHDVGKLMIPKSIIQKASALDSVEMSLMRQHCDLGVNITAGLGLPEACTLIIRQHHERNNGSGYPLGLTEDGINRLAKIVMIADVVDAITSYRPYRPAKGMPEALHSLKESDMFSNDYIAILEALL
jgi:putative nucleotidyltransferase with HDIG domain